MLNFRFKTINFNDTTYNSSSSNCYIIVIPVNHKNELIEVEVVE